MNKIISIKQKFLCKDCEYILEISRLKVKKAKQYGTLFCFSVSTEIKVLMGITA